MATSAKCLLDACHPLRQEGRRHCARAARGRGALRLRQGDRERGRLRAIRQGLCWQRLAHSAADAAPGQHTATELSDFGEAAVSGAHRAQVARDCVDGVLGGGRRRVFGGGGNTQLSWHGFLHGTNLGLAAVGLGSVYCNLCIVDIAQR